MGDVAAVAVDVLAEQRDLSGDADGGQQPPARTRSRRMELLVSLPRTEGTMQKAQALSQPTWMVTQAL